MNEKALQRCNRQASNQVSRSTFSRFATKAEMENLMKKLATVLTALALAALPATTYAAGLSTTVNTATNAAASTAAGASLSDKSTFTDVMGSLSTNSTNSMGATTDYGSIKTSSHVSFVQVSKLKGYSANGLKLSKANAASMTKLDANVAANAALTAKLKKAGYLPSDVAAVSTDAKGNVTVFVTK